VALVLNGQIDEEIAEYERAMQLHPDTGKLAYLVDAYVRKGDRPKALQIFERVKQSSNTPSLMTQMLSIRGLTLPPARPC